MASWAGEFPKNIRQFIDNTTPLVRYEIDHEYLFSWNVLQRFYLKRIYTPVWITNNTLDPNGHVLLEYIRHVDLQGLQPTDYHLNLIEKYVDKLVPFIPLDHADMMKLDLLLTDAFLLLGFQLYYGKVDPEKEGANWRMQRKEPEMQLDLILGEALAANDVAKSLNLLAPRYRSYWMMKEELAFFLELSGQPWPALHSDTSIRQGEINQLLPEVRERLIKLRYQLSDSASMIYDEELEKQVMLFQADWGLNADGVIGKGTREALNNKPEKLIDQLKVNMERLRWLPISLTEKYIIINIANFELDLIEGADTLVSMRVIVGKNFRETPVFNERITYIVFNPTWTVPNTILRNDVIPELLKGPEYLVKKNMKLLRMNGSEIAYNDIDWSTVSKNNFPYMVRQDSGPENALGRIKFMFPNRYDVYIHDTPSRGYFARDDRALSSGCLRAEEPVKLAVLLLSDIPEWSPEHILSTLEQETEQTVLLRKPVDVVLIYLTAWTDGNGRIQLRKDVYQRDENVLEGLNQKPKAVNGDLIPF